MSLNQYDKIKDNFPVTPDSTTMGCFKPGEDVLLRGEDGLFYFGTVVQVDDVNEKGLVQFGDDTSRWSSFNDLKKLKIKEESDVSCILCKNIQSADYNPITLCHYCRRGYHQNCHQPIIPKLQAGKTHWVCMKCIERRQVKEREKGLNGKISPTLAVNNNQSNGKLTNGHHRSLPYELENLKWDSSHQTNQEKKYCYCGEEGEWFRQMLQCCSCIQWFHLKCTFFIEQPILLGDRFFLFLCSVCNNGGEERLIRLSEELTLTDIAHLVLYNLTMETGRIYHDFDHSVIPFLEKKLKYIQPSNEILEMTPVDRRSGILAVFWQLKTRFMCGREKKKKMTTWGLRLQIPPSFPSTLSPRSLVTLKQWTNSEILRIPVQSIEGSQFSSTKKTVNYVGRKRTRLPLSNTELEEGKGETRRNLRRRQRPVSSGESIGEEESSDDVKQSLSSIKLNQRSGDDIGSTSSVSTIDRPVERSENETTSRGTLELFIPPPKDFCGINNPFAVLSNDNVGRNRSRTSLLFVRPLKTRLSEKDIRITKNGEVKRRKMVRKLKRFQQDEASSSSSSGSCSSSCCSSSSGSGDGADGTDAGDVGGGGGDKKRSFFHSDSTLNLISGSPDDTCPLAYSDPKDSILSYFGIEKRVLCGERYSVRARRVLPQGGVQYLMEREPDRPVTT